MDNQTNHIGGFFERISTKATRITGSSGAFILAFITILIWVATGPIFNYSDTWQLVINTGTTIITFLMVFLIQKSQNKESMAVQLKLNELIAANKQASNRMVNVENLTEDDLKELAQHYADLASKTQLLKNKHGSHSIEEAINEIKEEINEIQEKVE